MYRRRLEVVRRSQRHQQKRLHYYRDDPVLDANWEAKTDYEYVQNYKLLQVAFTKNRVQKHIDVDKLIRGKYQDNLEFCQWLKAFYDQQGVGPRDGYDPVASGRWEKVGRLSIKKYPILRRSPVALFINRRHSILLQQQLPDLAHVRWRRRRHLLPLHRRE